MSVLKTFFFVYYFLEKTSIFYLLSLVKIEQRETSRKKTSTTNRYLLEMKIFELELCLYDPRGLDSCA